MRIISRRAKIAFFVTFGVCIAGAAAILSTSWIIINWREIGLLVLGIIFFGFIIAGVILNTIFLVREIRRNERQDSFLNAVTHELKTPVTSIRLYLETLQSRPLDEAKRRDFYRIMLEDSDRLLGMIEQVLKAGEARHASRRRNWQEVNFAQVARDTLELARLRHNLKPEALRFGSEPPEDLVVMGNPEELRTAVFNLLDNAIKYSGENKNIVVDVRTPNIDSIFFSARDQGIGIPRVELRRIFNRFYRIQSAATGKVKGTGLGLFIVRSVVRRYGGDAYAESQGEGLGSTFTIRLPRVYRA